MFKKVFVGMLAVFFVVAIASAGYKFGRYLKHSNAEATPTAQAGAIKKA